MLVLVATLIDHQVNRNTQRAPPDDNGKSSSSSTCCCHVQAGDRTSKKLAHQQLVATKAIGSGSKQVTTTGKQTSKAANVECARAAKRCQYQVYQSSSGHDEQDDDDQDDTSKLSELRANRLLLLAANNNNNNNNSLPVSPELSLCPQLNPISEQHLRTSKGEHSTSLLLSYLFCFLLIFLRY